MESLCSKLFQNLLLLATAGVGLLLLLQVASGQQDFTRAQIPAFRVGIFYPARSNNVREAEIMTCRAITDRITRNSARFNNELVTNTNRGIYFRSADTRIMTSRMQSRLDDLASAYYRTYRRRMTVTKAWTPFPDSQLRGDENSLHYEGRTVRVTLPRSSDYPMFLRLAVQASFDWVYYATSSYVRLSVIPSSCERSVDCVFLLDRSGSVGRTNHGIALRFINSVVSFFTIGLNTSRVGMAAYSSSSAIQFDLNDYTRLSSLQSAVQRVRYTGGSTNTPSALGHAQFLLNPRNNRGARFNSEGIPKIAILITDGRSNRGNLNAAAPALRNSGVQVYTVGIGRIDQRELRLIASDPDDEHVFILRSYLDAAGFVDFLSVTTCDTPAIIDPGDNTTTGIPDGGIRYFQTECPAFSDKVLVELIDVSGTSFLFCSSVVTNPGPLTPNTIVNTTMGIRRRTGIIRLTGPSRVVYIGVQGQGMSDTFTLIVWDQLFDPADVFIDVLDSVQNGNIIYNVHDNLTADGLRNTYRYSIIEGNGARIFSVNTNGLISIINANAFRSQRTHNITVQAENVRADCQRARIRINIRVISSMISFRNLGPLAVPEGTPLGTSIASVIATGGVGRILYSFVGTVTDFNINMNTGALTVARALDFERIPSYSFHVRAASDTVSEEMAVSIRVLDINERHVFTTPCALTNSCRFTIAENNAQNVIVGRVQASDPDSSATPNGTLTYGFSTPSSRFSVDGSGNIRATQALDREDEDNYNLELRITDGCPDRCAFTINTNVRIVVTDANDNPPVFTIAPRTVRVSEDARTGFQITQYIATDADIGANAVISFSLAPSNLPFTLGAMTGILTLTGNIDFETRQSYDITVTALNPGSTQRATTRTTIQIINVNDNTPIFQNTPYSTTVLENSDANTLVIPVNATDADLGDHGVVDYFIRGGNFNNSFSIGRSNGRITVRNNIDRERVQSFDLVVEARDRGTPLRRSARATVSIRVRDENDNPPVFFPTSYSVSVREDLQTTSEVIQVFASDADEPNTPNSNIVYSIRSGDSTNRFSIGSSNGSIRLVNSLDFETTSSYSLVVAATDGGNPSLSATASVSVTVENVNENPPTITGEQEVEVSEAASIGTRIAVFQALDPDQMPVTFSITSGNREGRFTIDSTRGRITLVQSLDYETTTRYTLGILASDGQQTAMASLTVNVLDVNEFAPVFSGPTAFSIREEERAGTRVGQVSATDGDRDAVVTYAFVQQDSRTENFVLNSQNGEITTGIVLDREQLTQVFQPPQSRITVQISAQDNGSPSMRSVRNYEITLEDINDNTPTFSSQNFSNMLQENLPANQPVFEASATDSDLGTNGAIVYSFTLTNNAGNSNPFTINTATGSITTSGPLDCELQPFYTFNIRATDMGTPSSRSSNVVGNLSIIDVNDNSPVFNMSVYRRRLSEATIPLTNIVTVFATDADKGLNGEVRYSIIVDDSDTFTNVESSRITTIFTIDPQTGVLRNLNDFDFESATQINVTVTASDQGVPRRMATALVTLEIYNVDEIPPFFSGSSCNSVILEDVPVDTLVVRCEADDSDTIATGNQPPIRYSLTSLSNLFRVNSTTGEIRTIAPLDRDSTPVHVINIQATDLAGLFSTRRVVIRLLDVNDNAPQFSNEPYAFRFTVDTIQRHTQQFLTVTARDLDLGQNGTFTFSIGRTFQQDSNTETQVEVIATDNGSPSRSSMTNISVSFESPCQLQMYTIDPNNGQVSAFLLCSVEISPSSLPIVLGASFMLSCVVLRNSPLTYQWVHNGTIITPSQSVTDMRLQITYSDTEVQFSDAGEYACKVTSQAGSLQSSAATATIQVIPTIISAPLNVAASQGSTAMLDCLATGIPPPTVEWYAGTQQVVNGGMLSVEDVDPSKAGMYMCVATNEAGRNSSSTRLTVYNSFNVLELDLNNINNPKEDGSCQIFDPRKLESALTTLTNQRAMVTAVEGSGLCELSPCSPSPCQNGGSCLLNMNVTGGYECRCQQGYTGVNCSVDENECDQDPCGGEGQCVNIRGSFNCSCNPGRTGRRCQFTDVCTTQNNCTNPDESCVEIFTAPGYKCIVPDRNSSLVVGGAKIDIGRLNDLIQVFIEQELQRNTQRRRRRRQTEVRLTTVCEPRFILSENDMVLLWICPQGEQQPTPEAQQRLCSYLFELGVVTRCRLPLGEEFMTPPTSPPSPSSVDAKVRVVLVDASTNEPVDALDSVKDLEGKDARRALAQSGFTVSAITAENTEPRPANVGDGQNNPGSVGGIVGGVIGALLGLALIVVLVVVLLLVVRNRVDEHKQKQAKKKERAMQMIPMDAEAGRNGTAKNDMMSSTDNLIENSATSSAVPPARPPKASPVLLSYTESDDIYQNVTTNKVATSDSKENLTEANENDYDILPPKKP